MAVPRIIRRQKPARQQRRSLYDGQHALPEPKGKVEAITFDGPVQSLCSTQVGRLGYSELFTTGRAERWRNAAVSTAKAGRKCGLFLHESVLD